MSKSMRTAFVLFLAAGAFAVAPLLAAAEPAAKTLTGTYIWDQGEETGPIRAVFTPAGEGHWTVDFHFTFQKEDHTYSGTADGKLDQGTLSGQVESDKRKATFTFKGEFKDGKFVGSHARLSGGTEDKTGTLSLGG